jgi:hypothetical protein
MAMAPIQPSFAAFRGLVDREVFEPGSGLLRPISEALRRLWVAVVTLPDRGRSAPELSPEYFRFPPF